MALTKSNPWAVANFNEYLYFCCPECDFQSKYQFNLVEHAKSEHLNFRKYRKTFKNVAYERTMVYLCESCLEYDVTKEIICDRDSKCQNAQVIPVPLVDLDKMKFNIR